MTAKSTMIVSMRSVAWIMNVFQSLNAKKTIVSQITIAHMKSVVWQENVIPSTSVPDAMMTMIVT
jgi:hypothetical protein